MQAGKHPSNSSGSSQSTAASSQAPQEQSFQISAPTISLPKGGGAIRGMGEKFAANPVTGTGSMSVPIATSPGRSGFGPQLSLSYDSGAGNGPFGFGWSLSLPSITRKTERGIPRYFDAEESDVFILSGAEDLVPTLTRNPAGQWVTESVPDRTVGNEAYKIHRYRPRVEGLFARIERWSNIKNPDDVFWRSISKDNVTTWYGKTSESRIQDPIDPTRIFSWLICQSYDDKGNVIVYRYKKEDSDNLDLTQANERNRTGETRKANRYLKRISYGNRVPYRPALTDTEWPEAPDPNPAGAQPNYYFEVVFDYEDAHYTEAAPDVEGRVFAQTVCYPPASAKWSRRVDPFSTYRAGFEVRTYRLCQRVLMFHHFPAELGTPDCLVRSTDFTYSYENDPNDARNPIYSFLESVSQSGYLRQGNKYLKRSLPPAEFEYTQPVVQDTVEAVNAESVENLPIGLDGMTYQWTDLHGEGIPGILTEQAGAWFYKRNWSPIPDKLPDGREVVKAKFSALETVELKPNVALSSGAQFMDLAGDGQPDLVMLDGPLPGLYEHDFEEGWEPFRPFTSRLNRNVQDPNLKFLDLDGDGHADVLITEDNAFVWHASLAEEGFGPAQRVAQALDEEKGPRIVFADGTQSIYLADLSGDGLTDIVRIRNGEVCYWPNLGYGRFGAKVTMDNAPWFDNPDQFDHKRIRLADIDGSGTTDIIYLHRDGVRLYFNQSGNSWSQAHILSVFPRIDDVVSIVPTDLLGDGTACLVWSSSLPGDAGRPMRYVNLMGSRKPHLLIRTINNLGTETRVDYAPSTKFYLQDKLDGKPWITRLPFPVHVVERVKTYDHISRNRFVTRYAYHHGYFDGEEREFRGFGMVEQFDTEEFAALSARGDFPIGDNVDAASHVPPVHTKTWFHTGVCLGRDNVSNFFAGLLDAQDKGEYYREPGLTNQEAANLGLDDEARQLYDDARAKERLLDDTVLPDGLALEEEREACRALKGSMLRQEVYALDGTDKEKHPYTVTEQNFTIRALQPRGSHRHGVFFIHAREAISYHYERNPADPRIGHELVLKVDSFGNVERSLTIGYPRRNVPSRLPEQAQTHMTFTVNRVANQPSQPDWYRVGLPVETRTFEITKPPQVAGVGGVFLWNAMNNLTESMFPSGQVSPPLAQTILYEDWNWRKTWMSAIQPGGPGVSKLRLIEHVRTRYRPDDLGLSQSNVDLLLPLGRIESLALPGESYKLAFTLGLLVGIYKRGATNFIPIPGNLLGAVGPDKGGYLDLDGDGHWWIASGRTFYHQTTGTLPTAELTEAKKHFFLPRRIRDPFANEATVTYDGYDLLVTDTQDVVGNMVKATNEYRVLQPSLITDPNGNRSAAYFDALGLVVATAVMGKATETKGDSLANFSRDDANPTLAQLQAFIANPRTQALTQLKNASTRIMYDLDRFQRCGQPSFASTIARETHASDPVPPGGLKVQITFAYSDGFGRQVQTKVQAEQGQAPQRNNPTVLATGDIVSGALQLQNGRPQLVTTQPRWVGTGRTVFNNKGKPVKQYEPFFSSTHLYETEPEVTMTGVTPVLFYDPVERVIATLHPNHTYEKVVFNPWRQITYDVNDTVAPTQQNAQISDPRTDPDIQGYVAEYFKTQPVGWRTWYQERQGGTATQWEQDAATKAAAHADTPTTAHLDALGRTILTVAHNGTDANGNDILYRTSVLLDIEGNQREVRDAKLDPATSLGRIVMQYDYDLLSTVIHQKSMEAPEKWILNDVLGKPIRVWKNPPGQASDPEQVFVTQYDALRRPTKSFFDDRSLADPTQGVLFEQVIYGDDPAINVLPSQNLRGKSYQQFDGAGIVTNTQYDFKGNLLDGSRQLTDIYQQQVNWQAPPTLTETFTSQTQYDALNRPVAITSPHTGGITPSVTQPVYNEAGLLERIDVSVRGAAATSYVRNIDYNEKGQRRLIEYGNRAITTYAYDTFTFHLIQLQTTRDNSFPANERTVQDLRYTYDPVGNITHIQDDADMQNVVFFNNQRVNPSANYLYDPIYRLIAADGREHIGQAAQPESSWDDAGRIKLAHPHNGQAMRQYVERYAYDEVGNFDELVHRNGTLAAPGQTIWRRQYMYGEDSLIEDGSPGISLRKSNRLSLTMVGRTVPGQLTPEFHPHDRHGNITSMPHLQTMNWDFKDQLQHIRQGTLNAYYVYDAGGQRIRKVVEKNNGALIEERVYLGGFEIFREHPGPIGANTATLERETLHVMDDKQRIALVETKTIPIASPLTPHPSLVRYQFGNHLSSASLELDEQAQIISYEEYAPYGSSTYQAVRSQTESAKRYRYTGKERDEESGLYYHGARYYAAWVGRWTACDPLGLQAGFNAYLYCHCRPNITTDGNGQIDDEAKGVLNQLQKLINEIPQNEFAGLTRAEQGTRAHLTLESIISLDRNSPALVANGIRLAPEVIVDTTGKIVGFGEPGQFGAAAEGFRTIDVALLKKPVSNVNELIGRSAADVFDAAIDYKTGNAKLKGVGDMQDLIKAPYVKAVQNGDVARAVEEKAVRMAKVAANSANQASDAAAAAKSETKAIAAAEASAETKLMKAGEEVFVDAEKSASTLGKFGKGKGLLLGVVLAAGIYFKTGNAYAAGQVLNPVSNLTDVGTGEDPNGSYVLAAGKDIIGASPLGPVYAGLQLGMAGGFSWLGEKATAGLAATSEFLGISQVEREWTAELTRMYSP